MMFVSTPAHKQVNNQDTGIDISVLNVLEIEAPLGGTSIEYEIFVVTHLPAFKPPIFKENDVIQFSVQKAYREMEIFHEKASKKFLNAQLPPIPKGRSNIKCSPEEKRRHLDEFMSYIAKNIDISHSDYFLQFIGVDKLKQMNSTENASVTKVADTIPVEERDPLSSESSVVIIGKHKKQDEVLDLFPKMKVQVKTDPLSDMDLSQDEEFSRREETQEELDLFEEVKLFKETKSKKIQLFESEKKVQNTLFPNSDNDDLFRINSPTPVRISPSPVVEKSVAVEELTRVEPQEANLFEPLESVEVKKVSDGGLKNIVDDSLKDSIFQEKKFGNISLFQELDLEFGGITKDDEDLFYVAKAESKESKVNPFLSPSSESTDEDDVEVSIEELTSLAVPSAAFVPEKKPEVPVKKPGPPKILPKPVITSPGEEPPSKPQVAPRPAQKPPISSKPALPPKPKPGPKPSNGKPASKPNSLVDNKTLSNIDIMQYIEHEQKTLSATASLFD